MDAAGLIRNHGVSLDDLAETAFELYVGEADCDAMRKLKERFLGLLERNLHDPNIALLMNAASHLDEVLASRPDRIFQDDDDPEALVADELIGMSIAEYIGGKKALFNFIRYDRAKPGVLSRLPPFMDDAVGALVAATMTRLFEE